MSWTSIPASITQKLRLQPGRMFLVDTAQGRIVSDDEIKAELAAEHPYQEWLDAGLVHLDDLPERPLQRVSHQRTIVRQQIFGYTTEELNVLIEPMARTGIEALGSMGTDTPIAVLSARPRLLFDYFSQLFAQVTNPPLDAIREEIVTSLSATIGPEGDLLDPMPASCRLDHPAAPDPDQRGAGQDLGDQRRRGHARLPVQADRRQVPRVRGRPGAARRAGARVQGGHRGHRGRRPDPDPFRP